MSRRIHGFVVCDQCGVPMQVGQTFTKRGREWVHPYCNTAPSSTEAGKVQP